MTLNAAFHHSKVTPDILKLTKSDLQAGYVSGEMILHEPDERVVTRNARLTF